MLKSFRNQELAAEKSDFGDSQGDGYWSESENDIGVCGDLDVRGKHEQEERRGETGGEWVDEGCGIFARKGVDGGGINRGWSGERGGGRGWDKDGDPRVLAGNAGGRSVEGERDRRMLSERRMHDVADVARSMACRGEEELAMQLLDAAQEVEMARQLLLSEDV